jgi:3-phosphoshikimate 1-carboxyvinyltransferase
MLPIACALGRNASFTLKGRLPERPLSPLYEELVSHGCTLSPQGTVPFEAKGQLTPGIYTLDAGVSSQFISGLLFALPLLKAPSELRLVGSLESSSYVALTMAMLDVFKLQPSPGNSVFYIPGGFQYHSPGVVRVEGDWSNAAFWLCAGAINASAISAGASSAGAQGVGGNGAGALNAGALSAGGNGAGALSASSVTCSGLDLRSRQGDRAVIDVLASFGARFVPPKGSSVSVSGGRLQGVEIDARDIPDLVPILCVVGAFAEGTTVIHNAGRLRGKECDRLAATASLLRGLGADASETDDGLVINGGAALTGGDVSSWGDHRIAMAAAIAATACSGPVTIRGAEAVSKSYPTFFDDLRSLGGACEEMEA